MKQTAELIFRSKEEALVCYHCQCEILPNTYFFLEDDDTAYDKQECVRAMRKEVDYKITAEKKKFLYDPDTA